MFQAGLKKNFFETRGRYININKQEKRNSRSPSSPFHRKREWMSEIPFRNWPRKKKIFIAILCRTTKYPGLIGAQARAKKRIRRIRAMAMLHNTYWRENNGRYFRRPDFRSPTAAINLKIGDYLRRKKEKLRCEISRNEGRRRVDSEKIIFSIIDTRARLIKSRIE